jgi:FkbM family methyltransferase
VSASRLGSLASRIRGLSARRGVPLAPDPAFYGQFIAPGSLAFDIGANVGNRVEVFLALGARVVAVEPQEDCLAALRKRWADHAGLTIVDGVCDHQPGERTLFISDENTLSTLSEDWIAAMRASGRFGHYDWRQTRTVAATTLDLLIAQHGVPDFLKIDVEGAEESVLAGLSATVPLVSIEWAAEWLAHTHGAVNRLDTLGLTEFNYTIGESCDWAQPTWMRARDLHSRLVGHADEDDAAWGDVYARSPTHTSTMGNEMGASSRFVERLQ